MENINLLLKKSIKDAFLSLYGLTIEEENISISPTKKEFKGDFTLVIFPFLKQTKQPIDVLGEKIGNYIKENCNFIEGYNQIGGFINFVVSKNYWITFIKENSKNEDFGLQNKRNEQKPIVIEYSSPNTNKPLHLGHIRNNLLGWSIAQILKAGGHEVKKVNLVNDRGIHICKSMIAWQLFGNGQTPNNSNIKGDHLVGKYYVLFDKEYKKEIKQLMDKGIEEEDAKKSAPILLQAQDMLRKWENKDEETIALWKKMNSWVYQGFDTTYKNLGIDFDKTYYESQTYLLGKEIVEEGLKKGILFKKEDDSIWCDLKDEGLDEKLLIRKDGTSVYMTQDLGTALLRHNDFNSDNLIYVVGNEQNYHFDVLKIILKKLGFLWAENIYHLSYGMVELPQGKMKSREGTVVDADDLIEEMIENAQQQTKEHGKENFSKDELDSLHKTLALGALKYFILKVDPQKNMLFNPKDSIDFNGNTGPFIQYTYARICSLLKKAEQAFNINIKEEKIENNLEISEKELEIIRILYQYPSIIVEACRVFSPAIIANYAYDLSKAFNAFYQETNILREKDQNLVILRLYISLFVGNIIRSSMSLLGIEVPNRM
ncbi:MAG: arginine--tRNA ligase [Bacteroidales bacterium]|jgi:arginyl-tRNA synthetase|nr:arginine--tRNA ligase [Bacteroidales bacterium]